MAANIERRFGSLSEFVDYASAESDMTDTRLSRETWDPEWSGTETFEDAVSLAFSWTEGADRIERLKADLNIKTNRFRKEAVLSEVGPGVISMGNYLSGHPQPYVTLRDSTRVGRGRGKVVRVVVNIAASADTPADVIERRGAAVLTLCAALEAQGLRTEIDVLWRTQGTRNRTWTGAVVVKRPEEAFSPLSLAFALAHPSMLRRIGFGVIEREAEPERLDFGVTAGVYGIPANLTPDEIDGRIYLGAMRSADPNFRTAERAAQWVRDTAAEQGVTIR